MASLRVSVSSLLVTITTGMPWSMRADGAEQLEPPPAGHLLVEQHHAVGLALEQRERVVAVRGRLHGEALLLQKEDVGREALDLVVHPEDALGTGHGGKDSGMGAVRRTEPILSSRAKRGIFSAVIGYRVRRSLVACAPRDDSAVATAYRLTALPPYRLHSPA